MYCLDSSVIINIFDGVIPIKENLEKIKSEELFITPIALCELYKGAIHSSITEKRIEYINELLQRVELLGFDMKSCMIFGEDYLRLKRLGRITKDADLMIASICKAHNKILITTDKKHFEDIPNLKVEAW